MGLFDRLKARLGKTREVLSDGVSALFRGGRAVDKALLAELEELLYASDLGPVAAELMAEINRLATRGEIKGEDEVRSVLREVLLGFLKPVGRSGGEYEVTAQPTVILVAGVNGSGKTTTIAKLAQRFQARGKTVLLGACDTFRAAAIEQLEIWANRNNAPIVRAKSGADPASVAFDSVESACVLGIDVALIDTAGRLHTQKNLMGELGKVQRVIAKRLPGAPHEIWLVIDATNGQNAIVQAKEFLRAVPVTGLVITKLDGTARGGIVVAIARKLGLPIRFIGLGEQAGDFGPFDAAAFAAALVDGSELEGGQ